MPKEISQNTGLLSKYLANQRLEVLSKLLTGKDLTVLEIGCGRADLLRRNINIKHYVGLDIIGKLIHQNKQDFPEHSFVFADVTNFNLSSISEKFDYVVMMAFIEHLDYDDNQKLFINIRNKLKPNGEILMTTPHPRANKIHDLGAKLGLFSREAAQEHKCFFDRQLIEKLARETGYKLSFYQTFQFGLNQVFSYEKALADN